MSPTPPTFVALNGQLKKAHIRIRELEARETDLLAQNSALWAVITELTHEDHPMHAAVALQRWESDGGAVPDRMPSGSALS